MAAFGALLMISGILTSTLTQQAIEYHMVDAPSQAATDTATIDRATTFSLYDGNNLAIVPYDTAREQRAIFQGAFSAPTEVVPQVEPTCSSGTCTWPPYGSLAICGDVANLTALGDTQLIEKLGNMTEKRLGVLFNTSVATSEALGYGDFYFMSVPVVFPIVVGLLDTPTNAFNQSVTDLMVSDSFVAYTDQPLNNSATFDMSNVKYLEVALWWCTKTYKTNVKAGQSTTEELSTLSKLQEPALPLNMPWAPDFYPCYAAGTCNETYGDKMAHLEAPPGSDSPQDSYTIHIWSELMASALLVATMFDSVLMDRTRGVVASNGGGIAKAFGFSVLGDFLSTESPPPDIQLSNMRNVITNVARSATNIVRQGNTRLNKTDASAVVVGTVITAQTFVRIHWEWIAMLSSQLVLTTVFLTLTMAATYRERMQVIKCSSLATLCALDETTRKNMGGIDDLGGLDQNARTMSVRLERGSSGSSLWLKVRRGIYTAETE
ncbi:hypothetical protein MMYC01_203759 [Madurella mycetomatis]|uniref:Uncharacterized protein n=1 Tax=Madurella mycetomatis TaxID=100816 RepID=A0A175W8W8_9PEZI|nr:hypothetical protein MMYC01_203759 [Madurella mycetomatis]